METTFFIFMVDGIRIFIKNVLAHFYIHLSFTYMKCQMVENNPTLWCIYFQTSLFIKSAFWPASASDMVYFMAFKELNLELKKRFNMLFFFRKWILCGDTLEVYLFSLRLLNLPIPSLSVAFYKWSLDLARSARSWLVFGEIMFFPHLDYGPKNAYWKLH